MQTTIAKTFADAIAISNDRTGKNFFKCFENCRDSKKRLIEEVKHPDWDYMISPNGDIYFIAKGLHGEKILNKLTLHSMLTSGGFGIASLIRNDDGVEIIPPNKYCYTYDRSPANRKKMAGQKTLAFTTERFF